MSIKKKNERKGKKGKNKSSEFTWIKLKRKMKEKGKKEIISQVNSLEYN